MSPALASSAPAGSTAGALGSSLLALLIVIGLILALAWIVRRMPGLGPRGHSALKIVATLPVGMKERVMVIEVGDRQLLIGVTGEQITLLERLEQPLPEGPMQKPDFAGVLERIKAKK